MSFKCILLLLITTVSARHATFLTSPAQRKSEDYKQFIIGYLVGFHVLEAVDREGLTQCLIINDHMKLALDEILSVLQGVRSLEDLEYAKMILNFPLEEMREQMEKQFNRNCLTFSENVLEYLDLLRNFQNQREFRRQVNMRVFKNFPKIIAAFKDMSENLNQHHFYQAGLRIGNMRREIIMPELIL